MSWNATGSCIDWPNNLVWSTSADVQQLLSDVPLISVGVLGLASIMLLMLSERLQGLILATATIFGFAAGFFDMLGLLQHEETPRELHSYNVKGLGIVSQVSMSCFTSLQLLFAYMRCIQTAKQENIYVDSADVYNVQTSGRQRIRRLHAGVLQLSDERYFGYIVYAYCIFVGSLELAWRRFLSEGNERFTSIYLSSLILEIFYLMVIVLQLSLQSFIVLINHQRLYSLLPFFSGVLLAVSICITGFKIHGFVETPLARLLIAVQNYIWLLDILTSSFNSCIANRDFAELDEKKQRYNGVSANSSSNAHVRVSWHDSWQLPNTSRFSAQGHNRGPVIAVRTESGDISPVPSNRPAVSRGPVIRRSSRLPSWLLPTRAESIKSIEIAGLRADWQKEVEEAQRHEKAQGTKVKMTESDDETISIRPPVMEPSVSFENSINAPAERPNKRLPKVPSPSKESQDNKKQSIMSSKSASPNCLAPPIRYASLPSSAASRHTSVSSQTSDLSLSNFPVPPINKNRKSQRCSLRALAMRRSSSNRASPPGEVTASSATTSLEDAAIEEEPLEPPRMPAAHHQSTSSWRSDDSMPGSTKSTSETIRHKGVNVTSFIDASPDSDEEGDITLQRFSRPPRTTSNKDNRAQILRANSVTRQSARLLTKIASGAYSESSAGTSK